MSKRLVVIVGAGPYGLSLAANPAAQKVEHRIFGNPMLFWSRIG
jgi:FAD-dependent urate hydroxylase